MYTPVQYIAEVDDNNASVDKPRHLNTLYTSYTINLCYYFLESYRGDFIFICIRKDTSKNASTENFLWINWGKTEKLNIKSQVFSHLIFTVLHKINQ